MWKGGSKTKEGRRNTGALIHSFIHSFINQTCIKSIREGTNLETRTEPSTVQDDVDSVNNSVDTDSAFGRGGSQNHTWVFQAGFHRNSLPEFLRPFC